MTAIDERLDAVFAALGNPTRRAIVDRLLLSDATISELAEPFQMTLPGVSKHVAVLEAAGLVERRRVGRTRRCRLRRESLAAADAWMRERTAFWSGQLDALADYFETDDPRPT